MTSRTPQRDEGGDPSSPLTNPKIDSVKLQFSGLNKAPSNLIRPHRLQ
eukprot:CAMPEP_0185587392 /NCGR_PEP_ID=MMETSP0434-20130131/48857_1 /TAXON_ID=626734 ORGANISM="Favella taraikaensis, Strain Fe Narragansett Bay" /NCGR_SAMPLE_ID=MMETSP0434 /ASSEMBLY_ACC=CAM_ASM_000379 /LENGTH=47 /DNA_ID= /DNA_START= /DNA_END= /DNA_ORIENTATION=